MKLGLFGIDLGALGDDPERAVHFGPAGPALHIGGHGPAAARRAVTHGTGWYGWSLSPDKAASAIIALREGRGCTA